MLIDTKAPVPSSYDYNLADLDAHFAAAVGAQAAVLAEQVAKASEFGSAVTEAGLNSLQRDWDAVKVLQQTGADIVTTKKLIGTLPGSSLADQIASGSAVPTHVMSEHIPL